MLGGGGGEGYKQQTIDLISVYLLSLKISQLFENDDDDDDIVTVNVN